MASCFTVFSDACFLTRACTHTHTHTSHTRSYVFGGSAPPAGSRNDLWLYDTKAATWTWLSGGQRDVVVLRFVNLTPRHTDSQPNAPGNYTAGPQATPGARDSACAFASAGEFNGLVCACVSSIF